MEVEIEDLHLQIDDIAKAKTAVRVWVSRAEIGGLRENKVMTVATFTPGGFLHARAFCKDSGLLSSASLHSEHRPGRREPAKAHLPV